MRQPEPSRNVHSPPWGALLLSLALHAVLVAAIALAPPLPRPPGNPTLSMRLVAASPDEPRPAPGPVRAAPESAASAEQPVPVVDAQDLAKEPNADEPPSPEQARGRPQRDQPASLRDRVGPGISARILDQIADGESAFEAEGDAAPGLPWTGTGSAIPGLPGTRGWLSGHVGRVAPASQRWQANDGSQRARYVLADGTVVCSQRRAPTIDELMNPWKSLAVTLVSVCGRERPPPPDFSDPRVQSPPRPRSGDAAEG